MRARPTHVNKLLGQRINYIIYIDALGIDAGVVWMSTTGEYSNIVWWMEWPKIVSYRLVSDIKLAGTIRNSDLKMAEILVAWIVLEDIAATKHKSSLLRCDNTPACSWATRMSPKSKITVILVRALTLCQNLYQAAPMSTVHEAGENNDISGIPS